MEEVVVDDHGIMGDDEPTKLVIVWVIINWL